MSIQSEYVPQLRHWLASLGVKVKEIAVAAEDAVVKEAHVLADEAREFETLAVHEYEHLKGLFATHFGVEPHMIDTHIIHPDTLPQEAQDAIAAAQPKNESGEPAKAGDLPISTAPQVPENSTPPETPPVVEPTAEAPALPTEPAAAITTESVPALPTEEVAAVTTAEVPALPTDTVAPVQTPTDAPAAETHDAPKSE